VPTITLLRLLLRASSRWLETEIDSRENPKVQSPAQRAVQFLTFIATMNGYRAIEIMAPQAAAACRKSASRTAFTERESLMGKERECLGIPEHWWDNEVHMKENPDEGYSPEFVEAEKKKLERLKAELAARKKS
jgi:hypothetical protein